MADGYATPQWRATGARTAVVELGGAPIGSIDWREQPGAQPGTWRVEVDLAQPLWANGVGSKLVADVSDHLLAGVAHRLVAHPHMSTPMARAYEAAGFVPRQPGVFERRRRPSELASWRAGGRQMIPRPPTWSLGTRPSWFDDAVRQPVAIDAVLDRVGAHGPGSPSVVDVVNPRRSAVLVALFDGDYGTEVLLTRRSWHLSSHRGEVCFPGGRLDPGETAIDAALREAHEEVALSPLAITVIGELDHVGTLVSASTIVPVVARLAGPPNVTASIDEVGRVFSVPLAELLRHDTYRREHWGDDHEVRALHFFDLDDETVWGATGRMLMQLLEIGLNPDAPPR